MQQFATLSNILKLYATICSFMQNFAIICNNLKFYAMFCYYIQQFAIILCNNLQFYATFWYYYMQQFAVFCNIFQFYATICTFMQLFQFYATLSILCNTLQMCLQILGQFGVYQRFKQCHSTGPWCQYHHSFCCCEVIKCLSVCPRKCFWPKSYICSLGTEPASNWYCSIVSMCLCHSQPLPPQSNISEYGYNLPYSTSKSG
jgi:hypothetical protein